MAESLAEPATPEDPYLAALTSAAYILEYPLPRERDEAVCAEMAVALDALFSRVARGRGAMDISVGEQLEALSKGDRVLRLGFSGIGDYARERLGIAASTAVKMARFARQLRDRPLLRAAVWTGDVTPRAAQAVMPAAFGENEAACVVQARERSVRSLNAEFRGTGAASEDEEAEDWERIRISLPDEARAEVDEALGLITWLTGPGTPKGERVGYICEEYLGAHPLPDQDAAGVEPSAASADDGQEALKAHLEELSANWAFLAQPPPVQAERACDQDEADPFALDAELQRLSAKRKSWDEVFGHLALLFRQARAWWHLGFGSPGHYCEERLGMAEQTVQQRASLELRLYRLPSLRAALRRGEVSYEKARLIARVADGASVDGWIERARDMTCIDLKRAIDGHAETQMCARGEIEFFASRRVRGLMALAFRSARRQAGRPLSPGECLQATCRHFGEAWRPVVQQGKTLQKQVLERDLGRCQVPGCSRAAEQEHHIEFRSAGGPDEKWNLVSLCAAHHLQGVHKGYICVRGRAPDALYWKLGIRPGARPLLMYGPRGSAVPWFSPEGPPGLRSRPAPGRTAGRTATTSGAPA